MRIKRLHLDLKHLRISLYKAEVVQPDLSLDVFVHTGRGWSQEFCVIQGQMLVG